MYIALKVDTFISLASEKACLGKIQLWRTLLSGITLHTLAI